jgi:membrane protein implicated in regulation of membrane protease activity
MEDAVADSTVWWILVGGAVAVEMLTGTFYLLMLAVGMVAGAVAAHLGLSQTLQIVTAAVVGGGAVAVWHVLRGNQPEGPSPGANRDINLDVGESVHVDNWNADGTANIKYRGANWTVVPTPGTVPGTGAHRVREVVGNRLVVEKV